MEEDEDENKEENDDSSDSNATSAVAISIVKQLAVRREEKEGKEMLVGPRAAVRSNMEARPAL